jgi:hypothetical protein
VNRVVVASLALAALVLLAATPAPQPSATPSDTRPLCAEVNVAMAEDVDSSWARTGDRFRFLTADAVTALDGTVVPVGTRGEGIVASADHAKRSGIPGYLVLEARFLTLADGRRIPTVIDPFNEWNAFVHGSPANAPPFLGIIPYVSYGVGAYNFIHHGKDATVPRGAHLLVFVGDDALLETCRPLHPLPSNTPPPRKQKRISE